jgi:predicted nucleotidyltransferase
MINNDILAIRDSILNILGDDCEKIILFGSYAYGTPREDSDYDFYVVLKDEAGKTPIIVMEDISVKLSNFIPNHKAVDVLANYKSHYEDWSQAPSLERVIARKGEVLYDRI